MLLAHYSRLKNACQLQKNVAMPTALICYHIEGNIMWIYLLIQTFIEA